MALIRNRNVPVKSESNPYLTNEALGLELVSEIISSPPAKQSREYLIVDELIDKELLSFSGNLDMTNELELYSRLIALSDRLIIPAKFHLLKNKAVIGLGGKFSAGKSAFINSVLGRSELPTDQTPTTSVPTYIISGATDHVHAYSFKGAKIDLDADAVKAVSHGFQNTYGLGLAQYLSFIAIFVSGSGIPSGTALLDTPGYNKSDSSIIEAYSDSQKAYAQLRSIDYLIWLVDVENGTLTEDDIRFIKQLDLKTKILIVINKCDLKIDLESEAVVKQARIAARNAGIPLYDVVRYSSWCPEKFCGKNRIQEYLNYTNEGESKTEDIRSQVDEVAARIDGAFQNKMKKLINQRKSIEKAIYKETNVMELQSLVSMYGKFNSEFSKINKNYEDFQKTQQTINEMLNRL